MATLTEHARDGARRAQDTDWMEIAGRAGSAAKGLVYAVVGALALMAALGESGGETTGSQGALRTLAQQPFGEVLLWVTGAGLVLYALWRGFEAVADPKGKGTDATGIVKRVGLAISGALHGFLAWNAFNLALGSGGGGGGDGAKTWSARLMSAPFGQLLVGLVGLVVLVVAFNQLRIAWTASFMKKDYRGADLRGRVRRVVRGVARAGYAARGLVFTIVGSLVVIAALETDPNEAEGFGGALTTLQQQAYGPWLLALVAMGLVGYAAHCVTRSVKGTFHTG